MSDKSPDNVPKLNTDELMSKVDFKSIFEIESPRKQVNIWIREEYSQRYLSLQKRTRYRFGREIIKLIENCIDIADKADPDKNNPLKSA